MIAIRVALVVLILALSPVALSQLYNLKETTYIVEESEAHVIIEITRVGPGINEPTSVLVTTVSGTATSPGDFIALNQRREFIENSLSLTVRIDIENDDVREGDETFQVRISDPSAGTIGTNSVASVTIQNDDAQFYFEMTSCAVKESDDSVTIAVVRNGYLNKAADVYISTVDGVPGDRTATPGADYGPLLRTRLPFIAGEDKIIVSIVIENDIAPEYPESLDVKIVEVVNGEVGSPSNTRVTISDDDVQYEIEESSRAFSVKESTGQTEVVVTITRKFNLEEPGKILVYTEDGTATANSRDYTPYLRKVGFDVNQTSATANIVILDDAAYEPQPEVFYVGIRNPEPSGSVRTGGDRRTITIEDNESILSLTSSELTVSESDTVVVITVKRTGDLSQQSSVRIRSISVSATADEDYTAFDLELIFPQNQRGVDLRVAITDDDISGEEDEVFVVELYQVAVSILDPDGMTSTTVTIQDSARLGTLAVVLIVVGCVIFVILILIMMLCCCLFMRPSQPKEPFYYDRGHRNVPGVDFPQEVSGRGPVVTYIPDGLDDRRRDRLDRPRRSDRRIDDPAIQNGGPRITEINEREHAAHRGSRRNSADEPPPPPPPPQEHPPEARHLEPHVTVDHLGESSDPRRVRSMFNPRAERDPYWSKTRHSYNASPNNYGYF